MNNTPVFRIFCLAVIILPVCLQEAPAQEILEDHHVDSKAMIWLDEVARYKRDTKRLVTPDIIPKHLINDYHSNYTYIIRKEYRQITLEELNVFHKCLQHMKNTGDYDKLSDLHHPQYARAAHFGVAFLPWHRQYLLVFEQIVRGYEGCEDFFIPYWDTALDEPLPTPQHSAVWTYEYWGPIDGRVTTGNLGRNWYISQTCRNMGLDYRLTRHCDRDRSDLYSRRKITSLFRAPTYTHLLIRDPYLRRFSRFELDHGLVHCFIATCLGDDDCIGHFGCLRCSANDPIFWLLHSFVDSLWDEWANIYGKYNSYPIVGQYGCTYSNIGGSDHTKYAQMLPFPGLLNNDGFRKDYYPKYTKRPSLVRCLRDEDCYSPPNLLFCNKGYCSGKVREGGDCNYLTSKACYCAVGAGTPQCLYNRCYCTKPHSV